MAEVGPNWIFKENLWESGESSRVGLWQCMFSLGADHQKLQNRTLPQHQPVPPPEPAAAPHSCSPTVNSED